MTVHEVVAGKIAAGEPLATADIEELAVLPDILALGMLADDARRQACGRRVTYVLVAAYAGGEPIDADAARDAQEIRIIGKPTDLDSAVAIVRAVTEIAGERAVSGFSFADIEQLAPGRDLQRALETLRGAGLVRVAETPVDRLASPEATLEILEASGFPDTRLTVDGTEGGTRVSSILRARALSARFRSVVALSPLPTILNPFKPTTGYEDMRAVALARLAMPSGSAIQVDWRRYGPKLAQVALTFGANDLDNVPATTTIEGRRRTPLAEVRRNIEAGGFEPVERDGRISRP